jgi:uncharacterized protein (TIGR00303 family)
LIELYEHKDVLKALNESKAEELLKEIKGKTPLFVCTIATTETAKIPGISAAGQNPEFTDLTPPADTEFLYYGGCRCISGVPVTPDGIPTPAIITRAAINLSNMPMLVVDGGCRVKPQIPFIDVGGQPGMDIRTSKAVKDVNSVFERAKVLGKSLAAMSDYLVLGESIPGGTTTALSVMLAIGIAAKRRVSSSMPNNPHELKLSVVNKAMEVAGIEEGELAGEPLKAIAAMGDPAQVTMSGLVAGAAEIPKILAGGTQMAAVLAIVDQIDPSARDRLAIGTTKWLLRDPSSDLVSLVRQVGDVPIMAANLDFSSSKHSGLRAYESGVVKEGVGAGGVSISAMSMKLGQITVLSLQQEIEREYERILGGKAS